MSLVRFRSQQAGRCRALTPGGEGFRQRLCLFRGRADYRPPALFFPNQRADAPRSHARRGNETRRRPTRREFLTYTPVSRPPAWDSTPARKAAAVSAELRCPGRPADLPPRRFAVPPVKAPAGGRPAVSTDTE